MAVCGTVGRGWNGDLLAGGLNRQHVVGFEVEELDFGNGGVRTVAVVGVDLQLVVRVSRAVFECVKAALAG
jgi:hypothetical protein